MRLNITAFAQLNVANSTDKEADGVNIPAIILDGRITDEPDETIEFLIGTPDTAEIVLARTVCDGVAPQTTATYTTENDDTTLSGDKTVEIIDNGAGPIIGAVEFTETNSGLLWNAAVDYGFSDQVIKPTYMGDCNYVPGDAYDGP